eukprot:TRINITY_DN37497_c0_g1_i1.p1 TRINITY_DN37497_c0_g1~~TRINITY_DN37497_c0_g1_i1.p1  ORF type:complete len:142 (-),score=43.74 TRINITY_DN37497_c0_g1_i1:205-630(-)
MEENEGPLKCARAWVDEQGWNQERYSVQISEVQSCPRGCVCVDVTHNGMLSDDEFEDVEAIEMERSEILMRSRLLEVKVPENRVDNVLAARDSDKLRVQMELEHVKVLTEEMVYQSEQMEMENQRLQEEMGGVEIGENADQ